MKRNNGSNGSAIGVLMSFLLAAQTMATAKTYNSTDVPKPIPDPGSVSSKILISDSYLIKDVDVKLTIRHPVNCDVTAYLIHGVTSVKLFSYVCGPTDDFVDTILDDEAQTSIRTSSPPCTGRYQPLAALSQFDHDDVAGEWELVVTDTLAGDAGKVESWSLTITECVPPAPPKDPSPADGATNVSRHPTLKWNAPAVADTVWDVYFGPSPDNMILVATGLTTKEYRVVDTLEMASWYYWKVTGRNPCGETPGICEPGSWRFATAGTPIVVCRDIEVPADRNCQAVVTVADLDVGSHDAMGGPVTLTMEPSGPFPIGETPVKIIATTGGGATASAFAKVKVLWTAYCYKQSAVCILESVLVRTTCDNTALAQAIDYLKMSMGDEFDTEENRVFWAGSDRVAKRQGGFNGAMVFNFELKAGTLLLTFATGCGSAFATDIEQAWILIADAEQKLADMAIADAIFQNAPADKIAAAKKARNEGNVAKAKGGVEIPAVALRKYFDAWQIAIDALGPSTDYNRDGVLDVDDLVMFSEDLLNEM